MKTSSIENQASLWLVTCSDLFFLLFGFFVLNHSLPHEVDKGEFEIVDAIPAVREHLQERIPSDYAKMNNDSVAESNLVIYPVTQKWFSGENSLSLYGNTQFSVLLGELSDSRTSGVLEMELPEALGNEADFFLALRLKDLIEERSNKKISVHFKELGGESRSTKINLIVRY